MLEGVLRVIESYRMFQSGEGVVAGVSGGADSVALLRALLTLRGSLGITVFAAHVNHGLRGDDADADEAFVARLCDDWGVAFTAYHADVRGCAEANGLSLEEAGRRLRYELLERCRTERGAQKIAVAHNRDDAAETVLLNLLRGAGLAGLCGIPPVRGVIVRPLLETPRADIEAYLRGQGIPYRTDTSNYDTVYLRNRIRHTVMPLLREQFGTTVGEVIARNASVLRDEAIYMDQAAQTAFDACVCAAEDGAGVCIETPSSIPAFAARPVIRLDTAALSALPTALQRRVLRLGLQRACGSIRDVGIAHIDRVRGLLSGGTGRIIEMPHGTRVRVEYGQLVLYAEPVRPVNETTEPPVALHQPLTLNQPVYIPQLNKYIVASPVAPGAAENGRNRCTKVFCYDKIRTFLTLRTRCPGDRIYLDGVGSRKLQDYFTDRKLPRPLRDSIPLLADGEEILWILDDANRVNGRYKPVEGCTSVWFTLYE